jgi:hypothetical protein
MPGPELGPESARLGVAPPRRSFRCRVPDPRPTAVAVSSKPATRSGLSLPRGGCPFGPPLRDHGSRPASSLLCRPRCVPIRFRSSPVSGSGTRKQSARQPAAPCVSLRLAPLQDLPILPDRGSPQFNAGKLAFAFPSNSNPPHECFMRDPRLIDSESSGFRVARCSLNLLEPSTMMRESGLAVKSKRRLFRRIFLLRNEGVRGRAC